MLGKYSTISNRRPATTHIYAMHTYFSPWQTSTANVTNVTKLFLRKPAHPHWYSTKPAILFSYE